MVAESRVLVCGMNGKRSQLLNFHIYPTEKIEIRLRSFPMSNEPAPDDARQPKSSRSIRINEDVAATVIGLTVLILALAGVIPTGVIP